VQHSGVDGAVGFFLQVLEEVLADELEDDDPDETVNHLGKEVSGQRLSA
jgi:hypothetical protein